MPLGFVDGFIVEVPDEADATVAALDDSGDSFQAARIIRVDGSEESSNQRIELIGGGMAIALGDSMLPRGTVELLFTSDAEAVAARSILARPTTFRLTVPLRPTLDMTFARMGELSPSMHRELDSTWMVRVGFQEV